MNRYAIPLLLIAISFGVYVAFIERTYAEIEQGIKQKEELQEYIARAKKVQEKFAELEERVASFPEDGKERLEKMLPERIDPLLLLIGIDSMAKTLGLRIENPSVDVNRGSTENPPPYVEHHVTFDISTTYTLFRKFLRVFEKSLALRDFGSISFSAADVTSGTATTTAPRSPDFVTMNYKVKITTYSLR